MLLGDFNYGPRPSDINVDELESEWKFFIDEERGPYFGEM